MAAIRILICDDHSYVRDGIIFNIDPRIVSTEIEHKILVLIDEGLNNNEIADKLSKGVRTIESHRSDMIKKFNLKDGRALVSYAIRYIASLEIAKK